MTTQRTGSPTRFPNGLNTGDFGRFPGNLILPDRTSVYEHFDDFLYLDTDQWDTTRFDQGGGSFARGGEDGILLMILGATGLNRSSIVLDSQPFLTLPFNYKNSNVSIWFKCSFKLSSASFAIPHLLNFGHINNFLTIPNPGVDTIQFKVDSADSVVRIVVNSVSAAPVFDVPLFTMVPDEFVNVSWFWDGGKVLSIYRDDVLIEKLSLIESDITAIDLGPFFFAQTSTMTSLVVDIDYMYSGSNRKLI